MSSVSEHRTETRRCDVCGVEHTGSTDYDGEKFTENRYPWRQLRINTVNYCGDEASLVDACSSKCVAQWLDRHVAKFGDRFAGATIEIWRVPG